ncbi:cytochrome P450 4C1-like isoform X1 [Temnothorax curvispinosus]|uniref:Cytochrome P450 4C1-like isoform X1 n=1 Tax=Temnothorax curvispinosus TaxID=300111 RepID=A0A6J1RDW6_9HYME|nr:cytochrome P450 4C1-like isoform X1 [Temnothorax curvispinosus]
MQYVIYVSGAKWHSRQKILTPTFHFNILQHFIQILIEEGENMTKSLKNAGGTVVKDLVPFFSEHTLNAICETYLVPAGTILHLYIYGVHRDPNFWSNPEVFDPDRFLPEKIRNRHPYSYLPFSAGPRNCIGQRFAMLKMKATIAPLIHNFYLEPIDYLKNFWMQVDLVFRPAQPLRVKIYPCL